MEGKGKSKNKKRQQTGSSNTSDHEGLFSPVSGKKNSFFLIAFKFFGKSLSISYSLCDK